MRNGRLRRHHGFRFSLRHVQLGFLAIVLACLACLLTTLKVVSTSLPSTATNATVGLAYVAKYQAPKHHYGRPRFFLHIGMHKSGSTSLQCALHQSSDLLAQDSAVFLGKVDFNFCGDASSKKQAGRLSREQKMVKKFESCLLDKEGDCWHNATNFLASLVQRWTSKGSAINNSSNAPTVILSKEGISALVSVNHSQPDERSLFWNRLQHSLKDWNVTIVITYRRYFEWLVSAKHQYDYHWQIQSNPAWPSLELARHKREQNEQGGLSDPPDIQTLPSFLSQVLHDDIPPPYPYADVLANYPWPLDWNVVIANIHPQAHIPKRDIVSVFICDILQAEKTCRYHNVPSPKRQSPSEALVFHRLNVQAYLWGWWNLSGSEGRDGNRRRKTGRFSMMSNTRRQYKQVWKHSSVKDLWQDSTTNMDTLDCPSRDLLQDLLERSLTMERQLISQYAGRAKVMGRVVNESEHREHFWNTTQLYCSVNAADVLQQPHHDWKSYYQSM